MLGRGSVCVCGGGRGGGGKGVEETFVAKLQTMQNMPRIDNCSLYARPNPL